MTAYDFLVSVGLGRTTWRSGSVELAIITIELEGQEMVFLNGGPAHQRNPAFSFFVGCDSQKEIESHWGKLIEGGKPIACGWLSDRFAYAGRLCHATLAS